MPSTFFGLNIAGSGLRAANAALNTTANNISNAQTADYSRQQVVQEASDALRVFTTYGCAGAGVDTVAIERIRDKFYDVKYWNNNTNLGEFSSKQYYMETMENYFKDDGKTGFKTVYNKMAAALDSIVSNASSDTSKAEFISSAKTLTEYFNAMYGNLQEMQSDANQEIKQSIDEVNSIASKLSTLNKQINVIEMTGTTANELRDKRDALIDDLSLLTSVEVKETPIYDQNGNATGANRYLVQIAGGAVLVDTDDYNQLECVARTSGQKINQTDIDGLYDVQWSTGNEFSLNNASLGGKLQGLFELRDGNNTANFDGKVTAIGSAAGGNSTVNIQVTDENLEDMKQCMLSDSGGRITIANKVFEYTDWTFDQPTNTYTFTLNDSASPISTGMVGKTAKTSDEIDYQGIPYYMAQMNAWVRGFSEKMNDIFKAGTNSDGGAGCILFTGKSPTSGEYTAADLDATTGNGYYEMTAGNFTVNSDLLDNAGLLGTRSSAEVGVEECEQVNQAIELLTSKSMFSFRNNSADKFLETILSDVALNASNANTFNTTYTSLEKTIANQRNAISGVDEDEEAVSLVKFQNSYTLASKMIQTLTEVYDQLILNTGV